MSFTMNHTPLLDRIKANDPSLNYIVINVGGYEHRLEVSSTYLDKSGSYLGEEILEFLEALQANAGINHVKLAEGFSDEFPLACQVVDALAKRKKVDILDVTVYPGFESGLSFLLHSLTDLEELNLFSMAHDYEAVGEGLENHASLRKFKIVQVPYNEAEGDRQDREEEEWEMSPPRTGVRSGLHDTLGRALVSMPKLKEAIIMQAYARPIFSANILEGLLLRTSVLHTLKLMNVRFNDEECHKLASGLAKASSLVTLYLGVNALSDEAFANLIDSFQCLENLQELELFFPSRRVGLLAGAAMYWYLKQASTLLKLTVQHAYVQQDADENGIARRVANDGPDYVCYAIAKDLVLNTSIEELKLRSDRLDFVGYNDFEDHVKDKCPSPERKKSRRAEHESTDAGRSVASTLAGGLALNESVNKLILDESTIQDNTLGTIGEPLVEGKNTTLKTLGLQDWESRYGEGSMTVSSDTLLCLVKSSTSLEDIKGSMHSFRWDPTASCGDFKPQGYNEERANQYQEEIEGWLLLNKEGRGDLVKGMLAKDAAVDLLVKTKENTHCAFGLLCSKPDAFFT